MFGAIANCREDISRLVDMVGLMANLSLVDLDGPFVELVSPLGDLVGPWEDLMGNWNIWLIFWKARLIC